MATSDQDLAQPRGLSDDRSREVDTGMEIQAEDSDSELEDTELIDQQSEDWVMMEAGDLCSSPSEGLSQDGDANMAAQDDRSELRSTDLSQSPTEISPMTKAAGPENKDQAEVKPTRPRRQRRHRSSFTKDNIEEFLSLAEFDDVGQEDPEPRPRRSRLQSTAYYFPTIYSSTNLIKLCQTQTLNRVKIPNGVPNLVGARMTRDMLLDKTRIPRFAATI